MLEEPKGFAQLEVIMYGANNEMGLDRISVRLSGETLLSVAAQLENIGGANLFYETPTTKVWLHGGVIWESEEQRQEYMRNHKYIVIK